MDHHFGTLIFTDAALKSNDQSIILFRLEHIKNGRKTSQKTTDCTSKQNLCRPGILGPIIR